MVGYDEYLERSKLREMEGRRRNMAVMDLAKKSVFTFRESYMRGKIITFYIDDGIVKKDVKTDYDIYVNQFEYGRYAVLQLEKKKEIGVRFFGDEAFFYPLQYDSIAKIFDKCVGKTVCDLEDEMKRFGDERKKRIEKEEQKNAVYNSWKNRIGEYIIGVDRKIDVFPTGFSVRVLFHSDKSFEERKQFVKSNKKEILNYVIEELDSMYSVSKRVGDMSFYKPTLITTMRIPEAEIKFEVKSLDTEKSV